VITQKNYYSILVKAVIAHGNYFVMKQTRYDYLWLWFGPTGFIAP